MTSYRSAGGGGFLGTDRPITIQTDVSVTDALRSYLSQGVIGEDHEHSIWSFAPSAATSVLIETSPRAITRLDEIAQFEPEPLDETSAGFLRVRVTL